LRSISKILIAASVFACAIPAPAQIANPFGKKPTPAQQEEQQAKKDAKNTETYEKIKTDSQTRYQSDLAFKASVDEDFDALLREHKAIAYDRNIHRGSKVYAVHEDRFRMHESLYDNLLVQDHINRIGQHLVPKDSDKVFAFRLLPDPTPNAETLATGTVYISTGMLSVLDNEAQVAYVLAHEMAHIQLDHWRLKVMMQHGLDAYNEDQQKKAERIAAGVSILGAGLGAGIGKSIGSTIAGAATGLAAGAIIGGLMNQKAVVSWDKAQEDEADKMAMKYLLDSQYDVREVPKLYIALEKTASRDTRTTLGFLGERNRVKQRRETSEKLIGEAYKADIELQLKNGGFKGDSAAHRNLMAELKRDNGIMAYYNDMFQIARQNLEEAVSIRENDPAAQYYLGKVLETIGRTPEDQKAAETAFSKAALYDDQRENFGSHLHYALMMMNDTAGSNTQQITKELDTYVTDYVKYQVEYSRSLLLPPNLDTIYEYMKLYGDKDWQPKVPDEAASHVAANSLPSAPEGAKKDVPAPKVTPVSAKPVCPPNTPPGKVGVACAAAGALLNKK